MGEDICYNQLWVIVFQNTKRTPTNKLTNTINPMGKLAKNLTIYKTNGQHWYYRDTQMKLEKQTATIHQTEQQQLDRLTIPSAGEDFKELELSYIAGKSDIGTNALA